MTCVFPLFLTPNQQGTAANPGINQRALQLLFSEVRGKAADWDYAISVSAAEIYNESLRYGQGLKLQRGTKAHLRITPRCSAPVPAAQPWLHSLFLGLCVCLCKGLF